MSFYHVTKLILKIKFWATRLKSLFFALFMKCDKSKVWVKLPSFFALYTCMPHLERVKSLFESAILNMMALLCSMEHDLNTQTLTQIWLTFLMLQNVFLNKKKIQKMANFSKKTYLIKTYPGCTIRKEKTCHFWHQNKREIFGLSGVQNVIEKGEGEIFVLPSFFFSGSSWSVRSIPSETNHTRTSISWIWARAKKTETMEGRRQKMVVATTQVSRRANTRTKITSRNICRRDGVAAAFVATGFPSEDTRTRFLKCQQMGWWWYKLWSYKETSFF